MVISFIWIFFFYKLTIQNLFIEYVTGIFFHSSELYSLRVKRNKIYPVLFVLVLFDVLTEVRWTLWYFIIVDNV